MSFSIARHHVRYVFLAVFILLTFRTLQAFPGFALIKESWLVAAFAFLALFYPYWKTRSGWSFSKFELYVLMMMVLVPVLAGIAAWREFGQPIIYGMLAQRSMILGGGALALMFAFRRGLISQRDVEKALLLLAWGTFVMYALIGLAFDPSQFAESGPGFVSGGHVEDFEFKFRTEFIVFGFFYYAFIGFRRKSLKDYLMACTFLSYLIIAIGGRSLIVSLLAAFAFFIYRWSSAGRLMLYIPKMLMGTVVFIVLLYVGSPDYVIHLYGKFSDAFSVVLTGERAADASANARLVEAAIALPYILKHWLLGNGDISNQWHGGYEGTLGGRFYPSDIGIVGVVYMYGVLGLLLFSAQFHFAVRFIRRIHRAVATSPLIDAIKGFLLYLVVHSLVTGHFAHYSEVSFLFIALLGCIATEMRLWTASAQVQIRT